MSTSFAMMLRSHAHFLQKSAHRWWAICTQPRSASEDDKRREYILNVILLGSITMLIVLDLLILPISISEGSNYKGISFVEFSVLPIFFSFLYFLSRRGFFIVASYILIGAYFLSASYAAYEWGANLEAALLSYALIIVMASILLGTRFGFISTGIVGIFLIALWYAQRNNLIVVPRVQNPNGSDATVFTVLYLLIMVVAWLSNREIEKSLSRARTSERALKEERDLLEVRVEERTKALRQSEFEKIEQLYRFAEFGQLSSGLFHDLLNLMNAAALQSESVVREASKSEALANAVRVNQRLENFTQAIRKQLANETTKEHFSLEEGINQVLQLLDYKAKKERIGLTFKMDVVMPQYFGNPFKFHQVMMNLIINAMESYEAPKSGELAGKRPVAITLRRSANAAIIEVSDEGRGIPSLDLEKIFEPFFTTRVGAGGMGIGLATVKKIVEKDFGGRIKVECGAVGSIFTIEIPL